MRASALPLALSASLLLIVPTAASATETGSISGRVIEAGGAKAGIEGLCVEAHPVHIGEQELAPALTGANGSYTIEGLVAGSYKVGIERCASGNSSLNFAPRFYPEATTFAAAGYVEVAAGSAVTGIDAEMQVGGEIHGQVLNEREEPIAGACTSAFPTEYDGYATAKGATTNADGEFTITGLASETYTVSYDGCGQNLVPALLDEASGPPNYRGSEGTHVAVGAERTPVVPVDVATVRLEVGAVIEGAITDEAGELIPKPICVTAILQGAPFAETFHYGATTNGHYQLDGLPSGNYKLVFDDACEGTEEWARQYYDGASSESTATQITLTAGVEPPVPFIANATLVRLESPSSTGGSHEMAPPPPQSTPPPPQSTPASTEAAEPSTATPPLSTVTPPARAGLAIAAGRVVMRSPASVRKIPLRLRCTGSSVCRGSLKLVYRRRPKRRKQAQVNTVEIGSATFRIAADGRETVEVRLTRKGRRYVVKARRGLLEVHLLGDGVRSRSVVIELSRRRRKKQKHGRRRGQALAAFVY